jgi:hypothetical protein
MTETRTPINVQDYPHINPDTEEGKEELGQLAFRLSQGRTPIHFVFLSHGEEIGEMYIRAPFLDLMQ